VYDLETLQFLEVNEAAVAHYGYSRDEFLHMRITDIRPPEDVPRLLENVASARPDLQRSDQWRHRRRDGRIIDVEIASHTLEFTGRRAALVVAADITERRQSEEALLASEAQLRQAQKMEAIGRLAGGIAHDFNNLLTVIIGRATITLESLNPQGALQHNIELIKKTADRAAALTQQLLAFSRKQVLQPKLVDLHVVVEQIAPMLRRLIGEDVELTIRSVPGLWRVRVDQGQFEQVVLNLAVNARDAMPHGGQLTIETADIELGEAYTHLPDAVPAGSYVMLKVADTGLGMDADTQARIFEPFFTTKEAGKGTGLGLATVQGIVSQHGGTVRVYSAPGQGTTFKIYLPRAEETADAVVAVVPAADGTGGTETVLLVEDDDEVRRLSREILTANGYVVLDAADPATAVQLSTKQAASAQLLITDVVMPGMSGPQLAERIKTRRPEIRVLYVSGYTAEALGRHGVVDQGIALLAKPFSPKDLARKVREVLDSPAESQ